MYQCGFRLLVAPLKILHPPGSFRVALPWVALLERDHMQKAYQGRYLKWEVREYLLCIQQLWAEDEFQSRSQSLLTLWSGKITRGTNRTATIRKSSVTFITSTICTRRLLSCEIQSEKNTWIHLCLGRPHLLIWHRLAVRTRKELGMSEGLKMFEAWTHLK